jgi:FkbM family methyltransferase
VINSRRNQSHADIANALFILYLCPLWLGCHEKVENPLLAPQLLHDEAEMAAYLNAFPYDEYPIFDVPNVGRFYIDDNEGSVKKTLRSGQPWEKSTIKAMEEHVVPGTIVLDVGAHIGSITIPLARMVGSEGHVYAFEPQKKVFRELFYNVKLNQLINVTPLRFAVSSETSIIEMTSDTKHDGRVRIARQKQGGDVAEARALDSFGFSNVSALKIDVEGHEINVLRGAEELIKTFHPVIFIEIRKQNLPEVQSILDELGYSLRARSATDYIAIFGG